MSRSIWTIALGLVTFLQLPALAQTQSITARMSGGGGGGKCTFEVVVQGAAEVEIRGSQGRLVTLSGSPAQWRRLNCNQPLPSSPTDFKFKGVDGHGRQSLAAAPNTNNGVAVVRIDNNTGGNEGYTGDITWNGGYNGGYNSSGNWGSNQGYWGNVNDDWANGNNNWGGHFQSIHARVSGGGGSGKCTFEVVVNGVADVEIRGDQGRLRTISGNPPQWRRLDCNQPLPLNPNDFRFTGVDGHGKQSLLQSPGSNNGVAVIHIDNKNRGNNEGYTGDITWNGGNNSVGSWGNGSRFQWNDSGANWDGGAAGSAAGQACADIVATRIRSEHHVTNLRMLPNTLYVSQQSGDTANVQGEGQYQTNDGNLGRVQYRCVYNGQTGQIVESNYSRE